MSIHGDMSCEALGRDRYPIPFALSVMNWFRRLQQRDSLRVYIVPPLPMDKSLEPSALAAGCCFRLPDSQYGPQSGSGGQEHDSKLPQVLGTEEVRGFKHLTCWPETIQ